MAAKSCYQRAVDLLSRRAHFSAELRAKLQQRGFDSDEIDEAVERLASQGYLNDADTARLWVEQQLARKPQGPRKLLAGLARKGVDSELAEQAVSEATEDEESLARDAAERRLARSSSDEDPEALGRHLERLGFRTAVVVRLVRETRARFSE